MSIRILISALLVFGSPAMADEPCRLDVPLDIGTLDLLKPEEEFHPSLVIDNVRLNETPRFDDPDSYDPTKDSLKLSFFNIFLNKRATGYLGVRIIALEGAEPGRNKESVGFASSYSGSSVFAGSTSRKDGSFTFSTREVSRFTEPQHAHNEAVTEATVTVNNGKLVAVKIMIPIFRIWKVEDYVRYLAFTGEHQTLCLKSGEIR